MKTIENSIQIAIGGRQKVCPDEVIMLQADVNYSIVYLIDGTKLVVATTLKKLEERFSQFAFIRMNKTYMINSQYVIEEQKDSMKLSNSFVITFSRRKAKRWRDRSIT
ncbi:MAG: LytTR family transcriptional regulator [Spirosomaceae bacterium]|jgi:two-component system LytT family response regulator|nr:LytTR family transcriptional regulator [Spirosomataceae bacterium]